MTENNIVSKPRYGWLDSARGLWLISMIAYHLCYDLHYLFQQPLPWYTGSGGYLWQQSILMGFLLIAGFSAVLSHRPARRGWIIFGGGLLVTAVTALFLPEEAIWFGVLTLIGCAYWLVALGRSLWKKLPPLAAAAGALVLFLLTKSVPGGYLGFGDSRLLELPAALYSTWAGAFLGFPGPTFSSADYVPLLPWVFLFFTGYFLGQQFLHREKCRVRLPQGGAIPGISWIGRHSLIVYLLHQPLLYGALTLGNLLL